MWLGGSGEIIVISENGAVGQLKLRNSENSYYVSGEISWICALPLTDESEKVEHAVAVISIRNEVLLVSEKGNILSTMTHDTFVSSMYVMKSDLYCLIRKEPTNEDFRLKKWKPYAQIKVYLFLSFQFYKREEIAVRRIEIQRYDEENLNYSFVPFDSQFFIANSNTSSIQVFSNKGDYISNFGVPKHSPVFTPKTLCKPKICGVDTQGDILICNEGMPLQIMTPDG